MRFVVQRVSESEVKVDGEVLGKIGKGFMVLIGVSNTDTKEIADNLQKQGGFIEGVRPGIQTAEYLNKVVNRLDLFGALALGLVAMLPFITDYIFIALTGAPIGLSISGTGLLIVVTVALENLRSVDSRALMITYDDFSNESKD